MYIVLSEWYAGGACESFCTHVEPIFAGSMSGAYPFYVSISGSTNQVTSLVQRVLAYFTGEPVDGATEDSCKVEIIGSAW